MRATIAIIIIIAIAIVCTCTTDAARVSYQFWLSNPNCTTETAETSTQTRRGGKLRDITTTAPVSISNSWCLAFRDPATPVQIEETNSTTGITTNVSVNFHQGNIEVPYNQTVRYFRIICNVSENASATSSFIYGTQYALPDCSDEGVPFGPFEMDKCLPSSSNANNSVMWGCVAGAPAITQTAALLMSAFLLLIAIPVLL